MPAKRSLSLALALLLVAAIPARATGFPAINVIDTIRPGVDGSYALWNNGRLGDYLYFGADDGVNGSELWRTNGTTTELVQDINTGTSDSSPYYFTALGDYLYFNATDATHGQELWRTNGTTTELVQDINTGTGGADGSYPYYFTALGAYLYFNAYDATHGAELWRTNGTTTELVMDINTGTGGADSSYPYGFAAFEDALYFRAYDGTHGYELWRTNGTTTELVMDINTGTGGADSSYPHGFTALGDYLYFLANDGTNGNLWRVSAAGTIQSASPAGTNVSFGCMCEHPILTLNGRLFAAVTTDETGFEFAYLDEPTYGLPGTNRDGTAWSTTLVLIAAVTAAAGLTVRMREAKRD